jgi:hypothetical protein
MKRLQVFLSHTSDMSQFPEERSFVRAALDAVGRARMAPVDMRYFAARDGRPASYCQQQVRTCDVYVAIIGFRYGSIVSGEDVSYTDLEFRAASAAGLPRLVFLLAEASYLPALADADLGLVEGFRKRLAGAGLIVREFRSGDSLELEVFHALSELANQGEGTDVNGPEVAATPGGALPDWSARPGASRLPSVTATAESLAASRHASRIRELLSRAYMSALAEPITPAGDMPVGLKIPTLEAGYIDHRIRAKEVTAPAGPGLESWWADEPVIDSAREFLFKSVTSPKALKAPLVLLGQPGSGKSVLTRVLAAQFAAAGFLPVRVELRQADLEDDLQGQIQFAIRSATGEVVQWREVADADDHVLPVIIFDGFDELLQATGETQNEFLYHIQKFQEREDRLGKPLAAIVTSRTAVTDHAQFPHGTMAIRLEPFNDGQIAAWLKTWDQTNRGSLAGRGMRPLPAHVALSYRELAEQPLLLLMLALYDADANVLQGRSTVLGRTELYSRLLKDFASREIRKHAPALSEDALGRAVEDELFRLAVAAFAMFNRRSQWVQETDLDTDFSALLIDMKPRRHGSDRLQVELTAAQLTVGRFFFVHEARATHGRRQLRTYEFLHSTFGEYLVAHLVAHILTGMVNPENISFPAPKDGTDGGILYALLSFAALTARSPVVAFLGDLFKQLETPQRVAIVEILLRLHNMALFRQDESAYSHYEPLAVPVVTRHAAWSANLVVLAVLADGEITGGRLFPQEPDPQLAWRTEALIWRSQLAGYGWEGLHETIAFRHVWDDQRKTFRLTRNDGAVTPEDLDLTWTLDLLADVRESAETFSSLGHNSHVARRKINFSCNMSEVLMAHDLAPLISAFPATANVFVRLDDGHVISAAHALISALCAPYQDGTLRKSAYLDLAQVSRKLMDVSNAAQHASYLKMALSILVSATDQGAISVESIGPVIRLLDGVAVTDANLAKLTAVSGTASAAGGGATPEAARPPPPPPGCSGIGPAESSSATTVHPGNAQGQRQQACHRRAGHPVPGPGEYPRLALARWR